MLSRLDVLLGKKTGPNLGGTRRFFIKKMGTQIQAERGFEPGWLGARPHFHPTSWARLTSWLDVIWNLHLDYKWDTCPFLCDRWHLIALTELLKFFGKRPSAFMIESIFQGTMFKGLDYLYDLFGSSIRKDWHLFFIPSTPFVLYVRCSQTSNL